MKIRDLFKRRKKKEEPKIPEEWKTPGDEPVVEPVAEPVTEPVTEPVVEPVVEPTVEPEPVVTTEPVVEPVAAEPTEREKILEARIEELTAKILTPAVPAEPEVQVAESAVPAVQAEPEKLDFLDGTHLDEVLDNPEKFAAVLTNLYNRARTDAEQAAVQKVLTSIPQLVANYSTKRANMQAMVDDFYKGNPDLQGVKKTVAAVINEVAAENPRYKVSEVFSKAAVKTRELLGLQAVATGKPTAPVAPANPSATDSPALVGPQGSRKTAPTGGLKGLAAEVNDLISE